MPKVHHVKRARKANRELGIKKGQEYWWWKNRLPGRASGVKRVSLSPPRPSQVTGSPFTSAVLALQERLADLNDGMTAEEIKSEIESVADEARQLADEQSEKKDNMPDALQESSTGELLQERADGLQEWADALEEIDVDEDDVQSAIDEAQGTDPGV